MISKKKCNTKLTNTKKTITNPNHKNKRFCQVYQQTNVFDVLGPFLPLYERIKMRYLNKFFYQEFTNTNLNNRRQWNNDNYLIINRSLLNHIELQRPNSLRYQYPNATKIDLGPYFDRPWFNDERHKQYWNTFFEYCSDLWIHNGCINILEFIPDENEMAEELAQAMDVWDDMLFK